PKIAASGASTSSTVAAAAMVTNRSTSQRRSSTMPLPLLRMCPRGYATSRAPHQQAGYRVHHDGDQEQRQPDLDQRAQVQLTRGFAEFIGDNACHGVTGCEQGFCDLRPIADHHGHGHGLAQRTAEPEDDGAEYPGSRVTQHADADHL